MQIAKLLADFVKEDFLGIPVKVTELIADNSHPKVLSPEIPKTAYGEGIFSWDKFGRDLNIAHGFPPPHILKGWVHSNNGYRSIRLELDEFKNLGIEEKISNWECDIQQIECIMGAKSNLSNYHSLDHFALTMNNDFAKERTFKNLLKNLAHNEILILREESSDFLVSYKWDKRIILSNDGGGHHFAAARLVAREINQTVTLRGTHYKRSIDLKKLTSIINRFDIFVLPKQSTFQNRFFEAMKSFRATFFRTYLPNPCVDDYVIMLPKNEARSRKVSKILSEHKAFSLNNYLNKNIIQFIN